MRKKKERVIKTCLDVLPIRAYDDALDAFRLVDDEYMDILQVETRDLDNLSEDEQQLEIFTLMKIYKTVGVDIKIISIKFPLEMATQRAYLEHRRERVQDEARRLWIDRQIEELARVEQNVQSLHFFLVYFATGAETFKKTREEVLKYAGSGQQRLVTPLKRAQKARVVEQLCNPNTTLDLNGEEAGA